MFTAVPEYASLSEALSAVCGKETCVKRRSPVSGGDINRAFLLETEAGDRFFLKENSAKNIDFFRKEAEGLEAIGHTGAIPVPAVMACGRDETDSFLLMEYIPEGRKNRDYYEDFGHKLAAMHAAGCAAYTGNGRFGFISDNYIGSGFQGNTPEESWIAFLLKRRLEPQITRAEHFFNAEERKALDRIMEKTKEILMEPESPALLHGDLWSGNHMCGPDGRVRLIDPAVYVGHPEADIAMTELFGGFPKAFYDAYFEAAGKGPGYEDRRDLYNLYHLLNHLNLFGGAYFGAVMRVVYRYSGKA